MSTDEFAKPSAVKVRCSKQNYKSQRWQTLSTLCSSWPFFVSLYSQRFKWSLFYLFAYLTTLLQLQLLYHSTNTVNIEDLIMRSCCLFTAIAVWGVIKKWVWRNGGTMISRGGGGGREKKKWGKTCFSVVSTFMNLAWKCPGQSEKLEINRLVFDSFTLPAHRMHSTQRQDDC